MKLLKILVLLNIAKIEASVFRLPSNVFIWEGFERNITRRKSTYPFISGDTFRAACDHVFDETKTYLDTDLIKRGDIIFLAVEMYPFFFNKVFPCIKVPFIIVTADRDNDLPGAYASYLESEKIAAWFTHNIDRDHPKLHVIPRGLANSYWPHGNTGIVEKCAKLSMQKNILLCASHLSITHPSRSQFYDRFKKLSFCVFFKKKPYEGYLKDLKSSKFVLSPRGNGKDCHRTWEALLMGAIPIVPNTSINKVYDGLPVIIVNDWGIITKEFLEKKWAEMSKKEYAYERLYADYWIGLIKMQQNNIRNEGII